jgi:hypothetical protein
VDAPAEASRIGAGTVGAVLLIVALAAAISVDVVRAGYGLKGDEATYVSMALSVAFDHDITYQRSDLERFWGLYRSGPEGLFLKRGKQWRVRVNSRSPYVHVSRSPDSRDDRLYFGKALIYPVAAAPFVRLFGLNGLLVLNVLLLFGVCVCGYHFLAARSRPGPALAFTLAFVGATVVPVFAVFLTSDLFNFAVVFYAYFFWLYKEVAPETRYAWLRGRTSDVVAAMLLGLATFSKPNNLLLVAPMVLLLWWRRRFLAGAVVAAVFAITTAGLFGITALTSGEFNYQGGDRKTFYGYFPFDAPDATWERRGIAMSTNDADTESVLDPSELVGRFGHNVEYFLIGRHFGLVPYFFPGVVAICLWLTSRERWTSWRVLTMLGLIGSVLILLLFLPYSWSGGGGPPGNRYFLSLYPTLFFLTPPLVSNVPVMIAWIGGALFTAKMVTNPFVAAKFTYLTAERGAARRLPVELTMGNDLPIGLVVPRARLRYGENPVLLLYLLDEHAYTPEQVGSIEQRAIWISGSGRADILIRSEEPIDHMTITAESPIATVFTVSIGGSNQTVPLTPNKPVTLTVPAYGARGLQNYAYLLSARSSEGFTPHLQDPESRDNRNLGLFIRMTPVVSTRR